MPLRPQYTGHGYKHTTVGVYLVVGSPSVEASPGDPGRFLLSSMVPIVTGEIPYPILHCGRCHTLDTRALDDLMCSLPPGVSRKLLDLV